MTSYLRPQSEYDVKARRISGTRAEKLEQIDAAIQELLDIKTLECLADAPNVQFLAVPRRRRHTFAMTVTILVLFIALVLLVGVRTSHAQDAVAPPPAAAPPAWHLVGTFDASFLNSTNDPENHLFRSRGTTPKVDEFGVDMAMVGVKKAASATSRWGVELTAQTGHDTDTFGFSPTARNIAGADWLRRLGPTDVSYLAPVGKGLTIQGGIFSSLIGYDSLFAKDNFAYTRPWGADFTPYYMMGGNVAYPFTDTFTLTGFVVSNTSTFSQPRPRVGIARPSHRRRNYR